MLAAQSAFNVPAMRLSPLSLMCVFAAAVAEAQLPVPLQPAPPPPAAATTAEVGPTALDRVIEAAKSSSSWPLARTQADRLAVLREKALANPAESTPISDRYLITALGGPVDLVRFFGMARMVCRGSDRYETLYHEWTREGGMLYMTRQTDDNPTDCRPDDLPSNALGALFGEETKQHDNDLSFDLISSLKQFLGKLEPVSDAVAKSHPHEAVVLGLTPDSTKEQIRASREWFTAMPAYIIPIVAPDRAAAIPDAAAGIKAAGFVVYQEKGQMIIIERIGTPERPSRFSRAVPADAPAKPRAPTRAVPVD